MWVWCCTYASYPQRPDIGSLPGTNVPASRDSPSLVTRDYLLGLALDPPAPPAVRRITPDSRDSCCLRAESSLSRVETRGEVNGAAGGRALRPNGRRWLASRGEGGCAD